ncbi:hypothetical protein B0H13DRAFT_1894233 [Mycena leptocephala]|nr:hypothetical protein B0H13DRAFT_1894233 [Mycena leptocephala]
MPVFGALWYTLCTHRLSLHEIFSNVSAIGVTSEGVLCLLAGLRFSARPQDDKRLLFFHMQVGVLSKNTPPCWAKKRYTLKHIHRYNRCPKYAQGTTMQNIHKFTFNVKKHTTSENHICETHLSLC